MCDKDILPPIAAGKYIAEHSIDVKVSHDGVQKTADKASVVVFLLTALTLSLPLRD